MGPSSVIQYLIVGMLHPFFLTCVNNCESSWDADCELGLLLAAIIIDDNNIIGFNDSNND